MANKIVRYFPDTHMGLGHQGLGILAKKRDIELGELKEHEFVVFMNKRHTALKMFASGNIIAHLKMPAGRKIKLETIALLPKYFGGGKIEYTGALREAIMKDIGVRE